MDWGDIAIIVFAALIAIWVVFATGFVMGEAKHLKRDSKGRFCR